MTAGELWDDLMGEQRIISREEVEYEIAMSDTLLSERERLVWGLFGHDHESNLKQLRALYFGVVYSIKEGVGYE